MNSSLMFSRVEAGSQDYRGFGGGGWPGFKVPVVSYAPRPMLIVTTLLFLRIMWKWDCSLERKGLDMQCKTIADLIVSIPFYLGRICHALGDTVGQERARLTMSNGNQVRMSS